MLLSRLCKSAEYTRGLSIAVVTLTSHCLLAIDKASYHVNPGAVWVNRIPGQ